MRPLRVAILGVAPAAFSFTGPFAGTGSERTLADRAWDLYDVAAHYESFVDEFLGVRPDPGDPTLLAQVWLVHEWRRFPFLDPQLPEGLLPPKWIGQRAAALFRELHTAWHDGAQRRWAELSAD